MNWWFYSGRMGIRPRVAKQLWENRHNNQMDLIPYDQAKMIMEAQTAKTKDQRPVIKMVTPVEQATEMVKLRFAVGPTHQFDAYLRRCLFEVRSRSLILGADMQLIL